MKMFRLPKSGALSVTTLLIVIVLAAVFLPMLTSRLGIQAGFVNIGEPVSVANQGAVRERESSMLPCRGVGGQPCPEGTFCDGAVGACTPVAAKNW